MANETVTSQLCCLFVQRQPKMGKDWGCSLKLLRYYAWKLTNHHKTYLSVQCDILCHCCSSVSVLKDSCCIISFVCWSGCGILLFGKTQKKHPGDLPSKVPDLPLHPCYSHIFWWIFTLLVPMKTGMNTLQFNYLTA